MLPGFGLDRNRGGFYRDQLLCAADLQRKIHAAAVSDVHHHSGGVREIKASGLGFDVVVANRKRSRNILTDFVALHFANLAGGDIGNGDGGVRHNSSGAVRNRPYDSCFLRGCADTQCRYKQKDENDDFVCCANTPDDPFEPKLHGFPPDSGIS